MKYSKIFKKRINCKNPDEVFDYLIKTLKDTINKWDYFVNWKKVYSKLSDFEVDLNILNYLIGKDNIENEFEKLLEKHPSISRSIPAVIASRDKKFRILDKYDYSTFQYIDFDFSSAPTSNADRRKVIQFTKKTGFLNLLKDKKIKNLVDYTLGVEVGLDSNGRKNRGGTQMEDVLEYFVSDICMRNKWTYLKEANKTSVMRKWGIKLKVDKSSRRIDFVINNGKKLYLMETNFYSGGGSKLKSTAGEYKSMFDFWKADGHEFIWITDGLGWHSTSKPLRETFDYTDYILNLDMLSNNLLEDIIK